MYECVRAEGHLEWRRTTKRDKVCLSCVSLPVCACVWAAESEAETESRPVCTETVRKHGKFNFTSQASVCKMQQKCGLDHVVTVSPQRACYQHSAGTSVPSVQTAWPQSCLLTCLLSADDTWLLITGSQRVKRRLESCVSFPPSQPPLFALCDYNLLGKQTIFMVTSRALNKLKQREIYLVSFPEPKLSLLTWNDINPTSVISREKPP